MAWTGTRHLPHRYSKTVRYGYGAEVGPGPTFRSFISNRQADDLSSLTRNDMICSFTPEGVPKVTFPPEWPNDPSQM